MSTNDSSSSPQSATETLPPVAPPDTVTPPRTLKEAGAFDPDLLDHNVRRAGAYGALGVALVLYVLGAIVIMKQMSLWPWECADVIHKAGEATSATTCSAQLAAVREGWHSFVAAMVALFSVPTVLVIAVLRAVTARKDPAADSAYNVLGEKLVGAIEKFVSK